MGSARSPTAASRRKPGLGLPETLSGTRGGEPPTDRREFVGFARGVRHPVAGEFAA
jgi:hypothetical protein